MYLPSAFAEARPDQLAALIAQQPLATLIVQHQGGLDADHVPLLLRPGAPHGTLAGHIAAANPLVARIGDGIDCLAVFHGVQGYISPNGYASKAQGGKVMPTWNYEVVHVHGRLRCVRDPAWLLALLHALTDTQEQSQASPWRVNDAPPDYIDRLLGAIVGIEIDIGSMQGKAKLSQNQPAANQQSLLAALHGAGDATSLQMAAAIKERAKPG
ncbi:negative transcriptional regulator, PaiB family [Andreprevotia lacus DSM 23236]|jgi:transcriptional regulator|uniref:Negative transcriptional regulator, PaiB family n=1 Tax=Andreprevotia lacus DSM 23236 TaxID=1121001 RepID=A0A1W1X9R0_9NEIS|nr:FMN-binding negative transcriptional regulator [Andreprevotia lacus]SMC20261.1 negative transcriptional regulator, PaiB family [Andreprevotia lacus DSM 23236]